MNKTLVAQQPEEGNNGRREALNKLLTLDELAEKLSVGKSWLYSRTGQRKIPGMVKIGRWNRFDPVAIENWLKELQEGGDDKNERI